MTSALRTLVDACHSLPGDTDRAALPQPAAVVPPASGAAAPRRELGLFLADLASRLEPQLAAALARAGHAWDQVDAGTVVDAPTRERAAAIAAAWRACGGPEALLALLTLETVLSVVSLIERRLATLVRLRLRSDTPELVIDGRPFLDVPRALADVARRWS
jgi:hypothetical protein